MWYVRRVIVVLVISLLSFSQQAFSTPVFSDDALDTEYYQTLMAKAPTELIEQLTPLLNDTPNEDQLMLQLQTRYLLASAYYHLSQRDKIAPLAELGLQLAKENDNAEYESRFLGVLAVAAVGEGLADKATSYTKTSLYLAQTKAPDTALHGEMLLLAAQVYYESGAIQNALKVMVKANDVFTHLGDNKNRSEALASIALMYDELGQQQQALDYHFRSLELIDINENRVEASITYYNIALTYRNMKKTQKAREFAELSLQFANQANDSVGAAFARYELAYIDEEAGKFDLALSQVNDIIPIFERHNITSMLILNHLLRARVKARLTLPGWEEDIAVASSLLTKNPTLKRRIALVRTQAQVYESTEQPDLSIKYYKELVKLNEEQLTATQEQSTRRYQAMFELTEAEAENQLLSTQKKLAESELAAREFRQWLLIIVSLLLLCLLTAVITGLFLQIKTKKKFKELALLDELTRTRNRRSISVFAQKAMNTAREKNSPLCFAMIDVDHFKQFNDRFGHDVGDEVLVLVADELSKELRQTDALGRWGGEEWLIVLPNSSSDVMSGVFERIQARLRTLKLSMEGAPPISVSMGCTDYHSSDASLEAIIKRADEALYRAKELGRNRCEIKLLTS